MATPEKSSQAVNHGPLPIPFMQTAHQSQSVPPTSRTIDQSQANPWSDSDHISQPAMTDSPPASPLFQPNELTDLSLHSGAESSYTSPAKALSEHPSASSDAVQAQANISAFAQVPFSMPGTGLEGFSTHSGPPSIASSALSSPGVAPNGIIPSRRSSFLPRGMSSHLHKALRATAAAASKASAAIAPPPSSVQAASPELWQSQTDAQSGLAAAPSHQLSEHSTDEVHAARGLWEPDGHGAVEQLGKDTPWWQKQLRSLQHNLQSPESEDGSLPESDAFLGIADDGTQHQQPQISSQQHQEASSNGDVSYVNADQQHPSSSPVHSHIQLPGADAFPSAVKHTDSVYDKAALWQQQLSNGCHSDSVDLDRQAQAATQDKSEAEPQVSTTHQCLLQILEYFS